LVGAGRRLEGDPGGFVDLRHVNGQIIQSREREYWRFGRAGQPPGFLAAPSDARIGWAGHAC
jgi:hypothetical protein